MARRGPLSAAHKAAISAGLKRHWASKGGSKRAAAGTKASKAKATKAPITGPRIQTIEGGTISREAAAVLMFGTKGAAEKIAKRRRRR